ncbi:unnamed protein product [Rhizoctonia solani]|uniref:Protein kinase domain-containing protein n=1 Tax=Rhizoctonia solani TaxID=456999 RepID=A0A8H3CW35_9AGAM|nr:unnamed protein product [Rhizoctonia solani]
MDWVPNSLRTPSDSSSTIGTASRSRDEVHSANLTIKEMLRLLVAHGSADISQQIDPKGYSEVPIGVGGHGDVWKGRMRDDREIAVKVWRQFPKTDLAKVMKRTMQEIYSWSKIRHENIHELMGVTEHQGKLGIVSLWMEHGDLRSYIERNPEVDRYSWCIQVASGVSYLHQNELEIITGKSPYIEYKRDFGVLKALSDKKLPRRPEALSQTSDKHDRLWNLLVECWNHDCAARPDAQHVLDLLRLETIPPEVKTPDFIARHMSLQEIFSLLLRHGCANLSSEMDVRQDDAVIMNGGGFGDIWLGRLYDGTRIAIKAMRQLIIEQSDYKNLKRAAREIYLWSRLVHPNVHRSLGVIIFKGYYLGVVSKWMENGNLHEYMRNCPDFNRYEKCIQVTRGLAYIHQYEMAHGDLNALNYIPPRSLEFNILVSSEGDAKLAGFSLAIMSETSLVFSETTMASATSIRWAAPELLLEEATKSKPADVYALGMTMLEIFTGNVPYPECRHNISVLNKVLNGVLPIRPIDQINNDERGNKIWKLMLSCWDRDPDARPTASQVLESLNTISSIPT